MNSITIIQHIDECLKLILTRFDKIDDRLERMTKIKDSLDGDEFLDNQDLCNLLGVTKRTLQRYRQKKIISYYMIDKKPYYKKSEILSFFSQKGKTFREVKGSKDSKNGI